MDRPHAMAERRRAEAARRAARARAGLAAARARRAAAARRRGLLAGLLLALALAGWAAVTLAPVTWLVGAVPTLVLGGVLVAGRAAVVAGRRNDARWLGLVAEAERDLVSVCTDATGVHTPGVRRAARAGTPDREVAGAAPRSASGPSRPHANLVTTVLPATPAVGRAVHPSDAATDVFTAIVGDRGETGPSHRHASGETPVVPAAARSAEIARPAETARLAGAALSDEHAWSPVPVPPPAYVLKPPALRMAPAPLDDDVPDPVPPAAQTTGSIDLDAVLARRRASGL